MLDIIIILQDAGNYLIWPLCAILLVLILLQGGAGDISSAFGGGGQLDSSLGVGAQQKISKVTGWFVALFLVLVVILSIDPNPDLGEDKETTEQQEDAKPDVPMIDDGDASNDGEAEGEKAGEAEKPADGDAPKVDGEAPKADDKKDDAAEKPADKKEEAKPEKPVDAKKEDAKAEGEGEIEVIE